MEIAISIGIGLASFFSGLVTKRLQRTGRLNSIILLCTIGFTQAFTCKRYKITQNKSIIIGFSLVFLNILGRSLQMIGLTGGIACGKSSFVQIIKEDFKQFGIIDCDGISREIVRPGRWAYRQIVKSFGRQILLIDGNIDREELGSLIFCDRNARTKLNRIMQPIIFFEVIKRVLRFKLNGVQNVILDAPLLFESKILKFFCCPIITIHVSDKELWLKRLCERDLITVQQANAKIACQLPIETKIKLSDIAIDNSGSIYQLSNSIRSTVAQILK